MRSVWRPTDVRAIDFRKGPGGPGSFAWNATVYCDYIDKQLEGRSPKFACEVAPGDEVKVKFGGTNGEVYGEVLATRLLWALGFGADRMYPVPRDLPRVSLTPWRDCQAQRRAAF